MHTRSFILLAAAILLLVAPGLRADTVTFATIPANGNISGPPGSTVGWGFTLTNNSTTMWFDPLSISANVFTNGSPLAIFGFPVLDPQGMTVAGETPSVTVDYTLNTMDPTMSTGLYQFTWDPGAPVGSMNSGTFDINGLFCSTDPNSPSFDPNSCGAPFDLTAPYSVTASGAMGVPEPATVLLLASGLVVVLPRRRAAC